MAGHKIVEQNYDGMIIQAKVRLPWQKYNRYSLPNDILSRTVAYCHSVSDTNLEIG